MITPARSRSLTQGSISTVEINVAYKNEPKTYWTFAVEDLSDDNGNRSLINAFSNAKRALHFRVITLADALGGRQAGISSRSPFPKIVDFCRKCGIVTPKILQKLNQVRNAMEHEYYIPKKK
jgi:hypothetical protein